MLMKVIHLQKLIPFCYVEELTSNFQIYTKYLDLLTKVLYQIDM